MGYVATALRQQWMGVAIGSLALAVAVCGGAIAVGGVIDGQGEIRACFDKKGRGKGDLRLLVKGRCAKGERPIAWSQEGPRGPAGPAGPAGAAGAAGSAGSPDTPAQVLDKLAQVDGAGSGLDADLLDGTNAADFALAGDAFTKAQSDARFLRNSPRQVVVRADGTPAENGQALRDALAGLAAASLENPIAVQLTAGAYAPGAGPITVPPFATLRGAGRHATFIDSLEPVVLDGASTIEDLFVFGTGGAGPAAILSTGDGALIERVVAARQDDGVAEALRVAGGEVTVRDSNLIAAGVGAGTDVRGVNASAGFANLVDTEVSAFSGFDELRGVVVTGGSITMDGGSIDVDDNDTPGSKPAGLRLEGASGSTIRRTDISVGSNGGAVIGVDVETDDSSLSDVSVRASSAAADFAIEASEDVTVEGSRIVADEAGDVGIQTFGAGTDVRVATSRIAAPAPAAGAGAETCIFSYGSAFAALSAACL